MPTARLAAGTALLVFVLAEILCWQGWRASVTGLGYDNLINVDEACALLQGRNLPRMGAISSKGGYNPPGTAWLLVAGIMTGKPEMFERIGASSLNALTILGLWLLTRICSDRRTAILVVTLYSFSALGLFFGASLWPRAKPCAFVWMCYFAVIWVLKRNAWWLAASAVTFAAGAFIFLEMLPAAFLFPAVWMRYRPPVRPAPLMAAALVSILIWWPYLSFDASQGFNNLNAQISPAQNGPAIAQELRTYAGELEEWDESSSTLKPYQDKPVDKGSLPRSISLLKSIFVVGHRFLTNLLANFTYLNPLGCLAGGCFLLSILAWLFSTSRLGQTLLERSWLVWAGGLLIIAAFGMNRYFAEWLIGKSLKSSMLPRVWLLEAAIAALGCVLILHHRVAGILSWAAHALFDKRPPVQWAPAFRIVLWSLVCPWLTLSAVATFTRYGWWLWGIQVLVLGVGTTAILNSAKWRRWVSGALSCLILASVCLNEELIGRAREWRYTGFAGSKTELVSASDYVAADLQRRKTKAAAIGYLLFFNGYEVLYHEKDERYRIGAPIDQYLRMQYGIVNTTTNATGFSADDDYRLVELAPRRNKTKRFKFEDRHMFRLAAVLGRYQLWKRRSASSESVLTGLTNKGSNGRMPPMPSRQPAWQRAVSSEPQAVSPGSGRRT